MPAASSSRAAGGRCRRGGGGARLLRLPGIFFVGIFAGGYPTGVTTSPIIRRPADRVPDVLPARLPPRVRRVLAAEEGGPAARTAGGRARRPRHGRVRAGLLSGVRAPEFIIIPDGSEAGRGRSCTRTMGSHVDERTSACSRPGRRPTRGGQLLFSILVMFAVVGTLGGWAMRADRRRRAENSKEDDVPVEDGTRTMINTAPFDAWSGESITRLLDVRGRYADVHLDRARDHPDDRLDHRLGLARGEEAERPGGAAQRSRRPEPHDVADPRAHSRRRRCLESKSSSHRSRPTSGG